MTDEMRWLDQLAFTTTRVVDMLEGAFWFGGDECMKRIKGYYEVTVPIDNDTLRVHIKKLSPVQLAEFENHMEAFGFGFDSRRRRAIAEIDKVDLMKWVVQVFADYISVPAGQLEVEQEDGSVLEITTGAQLLAEYGGRPDIFPILIAYVFGEQSLNETKKEIYRAKVREFIDAMTRKVALAPLAEAVEPAVAVDAAIESQAV